jgi:cytochrome c oxidase subunit 4
MSEKIVPVRTYLLVFAALLVLTVTTWQVALIDLGPLNAIVAVVIAGIKASLVALFFMHIKYGPKFNRLVLAGSLFWLAILLALTLSDYVTRGLRYPGNG